MTCPSCGNALSSHAVTCSACGMRPFVPQPAPPPLPPLQPIRTLSVLAMTMLGVWSLVAVFEVGVGLIRVVLLDRVQADPGSVDLSALTLNDALYVAGGVADSLVYVATGVVFVAWLIRARANAEAANFTRHKRSKPWLVLGWIVPVVNLWFPKQIVDDIWVAGDPATPLDGVDVDRADKAGLVTAWWACWVISIGLTSMATRLLWGAAEGAEGLETMKVAATADVAACLLGTLAAGLAALIVRKISAFQEIRRAHQIYAGPNMAPA